jgi:hypothetical protein
MAYIVAPSRRCELEVSASATLGVLVNEAGELRVVIDSSSKADEGVGFLHA